MNKIFFLILLTVLFQSNGFATSFSKTNTKFFFENSNGSSYLSLNVTHEKISSINDDPGDCDDGGSDDSGSGECANIAKWLCIALCDAAALAGEVAASAACAAAIAACGEVPVPGCVDAAWAVYNWTTAAIATALISCLAGCN